MIIQEEDRNPKVPAQITRYQFVSLELSDKKRSLELIS
jgi:hypothetical protein